MIKKNHRAQHKRRLKSYSEQPSNILRSGIFLNFFFDKSQKLVSIARLENTCPPIVQDFAVKDWFQIETNQTATTMLRKPNF